MNFDRAREFTMPFGKFNGLTLENISETDDGLLYLGGCFMDELPITERVNSTLQGETGYEKDPQGIDLLQERQANWIRF